jgi:hypothetical protein
MPSVPARGGDPQARNRLCLLAEALHNNDRRPEMTKTEVSVDPWPREF